MRMLKTKNELLGGVIAVSINKGFVYFQRNIRFIDEHVERQGFSVCFTLVRARAAVGYVPHNS